MFQESFVPPKKEKKCDEEMKEDPAFAKYTADQFANLPQPSKTQMKRKAIVTGAIAREKKLTKNQQLQMEVDRLK